MDIRIQTLAHNLVTYSCAVQAGDNVLIESIGHQRTIVQALIDEIYAAGGNPFVTIKDPSVERSLLMHCTDEQLALRCRTESLLMENMQCYIGIRAGDNGYALSDVPQQNMIRYNKLVDDPVHSDIRCAKTRWVILRWPIPSMAQAACMSTEAFEDFFYRVCCLDYARMSRAMDALADRMRRTDIVHITAPDTDITFSIKGMPAIKCDGHVNIPDGEVYTAPVKGSVNGTIHYNVPSLEDGTLYSDIRLTFKDGKIIEATSSDTRAMTALLDTDEGARYTGEFAIGVNPYVTRSIGDTLFDEKISGSFHLTPGCCYDDCDNGNKSAVHWDLVLDQTEARGGGDIWFDGELIRRNGRFVPEYLACLNPEALQ